MLIFIEYVEFIIYGNMNSILKYFFPYEKKEFPSYGNSSRKTLALHLGHHAL